MSFNFKNILSFLTNKKDEEICNKHRSKKLFFTGHEQLSISSKTDSAIDEVSKTARNILKKYKNNPELILKFIENKGTKVILCKSLFPILSILGYEEGFIPSHKGFKASILNFAISKTQKEKPNFSSTLPDVFIICHTDLTMYFLAYQFYHWLSYKNKLPGYDYSTISLFKHALNTNSNISSLSINQILAIKDTIDRDKQAIDFVTQLVREEIGAKEKLQHILNGKTVKI